MIAQALTFSRRSIENPATKLSDPAQWFVDWAGGGPADSGVAVNQETATRLTAVWCAVRILSETLASLPLFLFGGLGNDDITGGSAGDIIFGDRVRQ